MVLVMTKNQLKKELLAAQISYKRSEYNENSLYADLHNFFLNLKQKVLKELEEYYNPDFMFQGQVDLILAPIFESQKQYYKIILKHIKKEYRFGKAEGKRLVHNAQKRTNLINKGINADKSQKIPMSSIIKKDELFGTSDFAKEKLYHQSFTASENTMNRIDRQINQIIGDGYNDGWGINQVASNITRRFDQLSDWESKRIARTEIHNAHNMGIMNTYEEMGVEYTQWIAARDARTRDSHRDINGEIIPMGGTYSNDLRYPGDTTGPLKEWINCRCSNAPFIMPDGYIAPSFSPFREEDLIQTLDYWNQDSLIEQATQDVKQVIGSENKVLEEIIRSNEFDIYRLPPNERKMYLKTKKNYEILKEAIETKNYSKLDELDHTVVTTIESKRSVKELGDDFLNFAKDDLEDYAYDIEQYEKIIKDKNIQVTIESKGIKWKNSELKDDYYIKNHETGKYHPFNTDEKFIKYHFKKENLTILESVDMDHSRVMHVYEEYKKLPKILQNTKEIVLSSQQPVKISLIGQDAQLGGYVVEGKGNRIVTFKKTLTGTADNVVHETTHNLEKDQLYYISNSKEYVLAFKKDQKRLLAQGKDLKDTYVTEYSYSFTESALETGSAANRKHGHKIYSEDLAESMKEYLKNKTNFAKKFPEKSKVLEKILNGEFKPKTTTPYKDWHKFESKRFRLTPEEMERQRELKWKQTDLTQEHKSLTAKEKKELQYFEDKVTLDFLHNKKIKGETLSLKEEKAYKDLTKKWRQKLKITDDILSEEIHITEGKYFTKKDIAEYKKLKKLKQQGKLKGFLKRSKLELLENQKEFDELNKKLVKNGKLSHNDAVRYKKLNNNVIIQKKFDLTIIDDTLKLEGKTKKKNIFDNIPRRKKSKWDKNIDKIKETKHSTINNKKYINRTNNAEDEVNKIAKRQNLKGYEKDLCRTWSGDANVAMNQHLSGDEVDLRYGGYSNINEVKKHVDDLVDLIDNMPKEKCLREDTLLFRGVSESNIDLSKYVPGEKREFRTLTSTSYDVDVADDFANYTSGDGGGGWILKIHAPKGTRGIGLNDDISEAPGEKEYLLSPNQRYITHSVDKENKIIEIELIT